MRHEIIYLAVMLAVVGSVSALEKINPVTIISLSPSDVSAGLPKGIYSVGLIDSSEGIIEKQDIGDAELDFIEYLFLGGINTREDLVPQIDYRLKIQGVECNTIPDSSRALTTSPITDKICFTNTDTFPVVMRVYLIDAEIEYLGQVVAQHEDEGCINVEPSRMYLVDMFNCNPADCICQEFENQKCVTEGGKIQMLRVRSCLPDKCASEQVLVDWIDASAPGCKTNALCKESDGGIDAPHKGTSYSTAMTKTDICYDSETLIEYYCSGAEVKMKTHYCSPDQYCSNGACVKNASIKDCGTVDGVLRQTGHRWCYGQTLKTCTDGEVITEQNSQECKLADCDYNGIMLKSGESVCLNDGATIGTCSTGGFSYETCKSDEQCARNTKNPKCDHFEIIEPEPVRRAWSIVDFINKLFRR